MLGWLFRSSNSAKERKELIVLMRPTVLKTPGEAALQVDIEKQRLPGVRAAERELDKVELQQSRKERKKTAAKPAPQTPAPVKFDEPAAFTPEEEQMLRDSQPVPQP